MEEVGRLWLEVKPLKVNCQNITTKEINLVDELVSKFRKINPSIHLKVTGCQVPHIVNTIGVHLIKHGLIEKLSDSKLKEQFYTPKF